MKKIREVLTITSAEQQRLEVPDEPGHYYSIQREGVLATEADPPEAEGESLLYNKINWYITAEYWEDGKEYIDHGYGERLMPNGDKIFYSFDGQSGKEEIYGGTGKFKNIRGRGRYKGESRYPGLWQAWHEWEYEIVR